MFKLKNNRGPDNNYRIVKVLPPKIPTAEGLRKLLGRRFYLLKTVLRSAYVIPL